jgi:hypothetical protein
MVSSHYAAPILEHSIPEPEFKVDIVTVCLTTTCSECNGEYVNVVLRHKFVCKCECHAKKGAALLLELDRQFIGTEIGKDTLKIAQTNITRIVREVSTT